MLLVAAGALAGSWELSLAAQEAGKAEGTFTVNGKTSKIAYAYAMAQKGFFDDKKEDVLVVLSDVPLTPAALDDQFERMKMAREGKLHSVEIRINSDKQPISGMMCHEAFTEFQGSVSASGMHQFDAKTFDGKTVAGKLATSRPSDFQKIPFAYAVTFEAALWRKPPPSLSGAAAKDSPEGKAVLAFYKAVKAGDLAAVRKAMTAESGKQLEGPQGKEALEFLKAIVPDPAVAGIESVDRKGNKALVEVVVKSKDGSETSKVSLELVSGQWKVAL